MCATWEDVPAQLACRAEPLLQVRHFRLYNCASAHVMESQKLRCQPNGSGSGMMRMQTLYGPVPLGQPAPMTLQVCGIMGPDASQIGVKCLESKRNRRVGQAADKSNESGHPRGRRRVGRVGYCPSEGGGDPRVGRVDESNTQPPPRSLLSHSVEARSDASSRGRVRGVYCRTLSERLVDLSLRVRLYNLDRSASRRLW